MHAPLVLTQDTMQGKNDRVPTRLDLRVLPNATAFTIVSTLLDLVQ